MMRAQHAAVLAQMATMRADLIEANARTAERTADRADEQIGAMRNQTMSLVRIAMGLGLANFAALVAVLISLRVLSAASGFRQDVQVQR